MRFCTTVHRGNEATDTNARRKARRIRPQRAMGPIRSCAAPERLQVGIRGYNNDQVEGRKFDREVRENLEIQKHGSGPKECGINQDDGRHVKTSFWIPMMRYLHRREEKDRERHARTTNGS